MNQILKQKNFNIGFFTKIINFINANANLPRGGGTYPLDFQSYKCTFYTYALYTYNIYKDDKYLIFK